MSEKKINFQPYPEIEDSDFYRIIYGKKEFQKTLVTSIPKQLDPDACQPKQFTLQNYQEFIRNYISDMTGYNSVLMWWGVGTGKTCGAIQIAEGLKNNVKAMGKKIYIITREQIKDNFRRDLYNIAKEKDETIPGTNQCTGDTYYIPPNPNEDEIDKARREKKIKQNYMQYYEFSPARKFVNQVIGNGSDALIRTLTWEKIYQKFSDCVFIIDEAHNLTGEDIKDEDEKESDETGSENESDNESENESGSESSDGSETSSDLDEGSSSSQSQEKETRSRVVPKKTTKKVLPPPPKLKLIKPTIKTNPKPKTKKKSDKQQIKPMDFFMNLLKNTTNTKLILMTATPMKNEYKDILPLLNLLIMNDKKTDRALIDEHQLFPSGEGKINEDYLREKTKGYISYVRGEDPRTFPIIKEATNADLEEIYKIYTPTPLFEWPNGTLMSEDEWIKHIQLVKCPMDLYQFSHYIEEIKKRTKDISEVGARQISNIVFPLRQRAQILVGQKGLNATMTTRPIDPKKKKVQYGFPDELGNFLHISRVGKFSSKIAAFLKQLFHKSHGIVYTYSDYVPVGANLIAMALEANGFKVYTKHKNFPDLLYFEDQDRPEPRCAKCLREINNTIHTSNQCAFIQAHYVLATGTNPFDPKDIEDLSSVENNEGNIIKVLVGTKASGEGYDFKNIREVHIMDPWHNNTRLFQVIGRAARQCSHVSLDPPNRYVKVFRYCASPPEILYNTYHQKFDMGVIKESDKNKSVEFNDHDLPSFTWVDLLKESVDERIYRRIEFKDYPIKHIERILKESAVDCQLNYRINHLDTDKDDSRECDYTKCDYHCAGIKGHLVLSPTEINTDTYHLYFAEPQIRHIIRMITDLFQQVYANDLKHIIKAIHHRDPSLDIEFIYEALDRIVGYPPYNPAIPFRDQYGRLGTLLYADPFYVFQPKDLHDRNAPLYYKETPLTIKRTNISLKTIKGRCGTKPCSAVASSHPSEDDTPSETLLSAQKLDEQIATFDSIMEQYLLDMELDRTDWLIIQQIYEKIVIRAHNNEKKEDPLLTKFWDYLDHYDKLDRGRTETIEGPWLGHHIVTQRIYNPHENRWENINQSEHAKEVMESIKKAPPHKFVDHRQFVAPVSGRVVEDNHVYKFKVITNFLAKLKMIKPKKGSTGNIVSKKTQRPGIVCGSIGLDDLYKCVVWIRLSEEQFQTMPKEIPTKFVEEAKKFLETELQVPNPNKAAICPYLEKLLRYRDKHDPKIRWFELRTTETKKK